MVELRKSGVTTTFEVWDGPIYIGEVEAKVCDEGTVYLAYDVLHKLLKACPNQKSAVRAVEESG